MLDPEIKNTINQFFISSRAKRQEMLRSNINEVTNDLAQRNMLSSGVAVNNISQVYKEAVKLRFEDAWESIKKIFEKKEITFTKNEAKDVEQLLKQLVNNEINHLSSNIDTRFRRKEGPLDFHNSILIAIASSRNSIFPVISADLNFFISIEGAEKENDSALHIKNNNSDSQEVEKIDKDKNTGKEQDVLDPKPPTILQNIKWVWLYGLKNWKYIVIAVFLLASGLLYNNYKSGSPLVQLKNVKPLQNEKSTKHTAKDKKNTFPDLKIKFKEGKEGYVSLTYQTQATSDAEDLIQAISLYGSSEKALEYNVSEFAFLLPV